MTSLRSSTARLRDQKIREATGYYAETFPALAFQSTGALSTGAVYFTPLYLFAGEVVSNLIVNVAAAGVGVTLYKVGLYDTAGNRLAVSAESSASVGTAGDKALAMLSAYPVTADGAYVTAVLGVTGTSNPTVARASGITRSLLAGSTFTSAGIQTGQTDLQASHTISWTSGSAVGVWVAVS